MRTAMRLVYGTIPALVILGIFTYFANWIPQTRWEPPKEREIGQAMSPAELAKLGQAIVREKGCMACHTLEPGVGVKGGGRGPNLYDLAVRRDKGVAGGPATLVDYLTQSLYDPSAYIVEGYPDIMPAATAPPAKLSYEEVVAVLNYLQSLGGSPSVRIGDIPRPPSPGAEPSTLQPTPAGTPAPLGAGGAALIEKHGCSACHVIGGNGGNLGPSLDNLAPVAGQRVVGLSAEEYVRQSIITPDAFVVAGFPSKIMPGDYGSKLGAEELESIVQYLLSRGRDRK